MKITLKRKRRIYEISWVTNECNTEIFAHFLKKHTKLFYDLKNAKEFVTSLETAFALIGSVEQRNHIELTTKTLED